MVSIANDSQLESHDRIKNKHRKIKQYAREAARATVYMESSTCSEGDIRTLREAICDLQERERELQQKVKDLHVKLQEANQRAEEATKDVPRGIQFSDSEVSLRQY